MTRRPLIPDATDGTRATAEQKVRDAEAQRGKAFAVYQPGERVLVKLNGHSKPVQAVVRKTVENPLGNVVHITLGDGTEMKAAGDRVEADK